MLKWRVISLTTLAMFTAGAGYVWWSRGIALEDYFRAAMMIAVVWWAFYVVVKISEAVPDPALRRILLPLAAALCLPTLAYHVYEAVSVVEMRINLALLLGIAASSYVLIFGQKDDGGEPS